MLLFAYEARDPDGKSFNGVQEAIDEDNAVSAIMSRGLLVMSIKETISPKKPDKIKSISETDLVLFTRQLATMVDAGLPLVTALTGLHKQANPKRQAALRTIIDNLSTRIQNGESFAEAAARYPMIFDRLYIAMVRAGEIGGVLATILDRLAGFLEASSALQKKIKSAMTYPVVVICIAFCVTTFLIVKVVPVFSQIFADFHSALPAPTQFLIDLSKLIREDWLFIIIVVGGAYFGMRYFLRTKQGSEFWDKMKLKLPVFGPLFHKVCMTRFSRTFAQLIRSGVPILEVLNIVGDTSGNYVVSVALKKVALDIENGGKLTESLEKQPIFPPIMLQMLAAGEATGNVDVMLEKIADFWDKEIEATLSALTSLIEPFLITFLGIVVGGIVISMFLPIFKLNDIVSGH